MIKKILLRCFQVFAALTVLILVAISICGWLLFQPPAGYAELRDKTYTADERSAVEARLENTVSRIEAEMRDKVRAGAVDTDTSLDTTFVLSQDDLNALLSSDKYSNRDLKNLRTILLDDRIRIATEVSLNADNSIVVSADFRLNKTDDEQIKLEILGGSIGRLPMPIVWLLSCLPPEALPQDDKVEFNLAAASPHLLFKMNQSNTDPNLKHIQLSNQRIQLDFGLPVVAH